MKSTDALTAIKELSETGGIIGISRDSFSIPLKKSDGKAIEVLEMLMNDAKLTIRDVYEILDFAKFYMELFQLLRYNDSEDKQDPDFMIETKQPAVKHDVVACPRCGEDMKMFSYGAGCTTFWRCPYCLEFGAAVTMEE